MVKNTILILLSQKIVLIRHHIGSVSKCWIFSKWITIKENILHLLVSYFRKYFSNKTEIALSLKDDFSSDKFEYWNLNLTSAFSGINTIAVAPFFIFVIVASKTAPSLTSSPFGAMVKHDSIVGKREYTFLAFCCLHYNKKKINL